MSQSPPPANNSANARLFGLRIESGLVQLAIAEPIGDGRFRLTLDRVESSTTSSWFDEANAAGLREALGTLVDRHDMRRGRVAISLDGDFCVTRIAMGSAEEVDKELAMLEERVPRYLQLGPGGKATGRMRTSIDAVTDYAVTGVVNRSLIQTLYDALRSTDIEIAWIEPSLISLARLVGHAGLAGDQPVLIADGTGSQWDVGIACAGRLLLDYRPAAATNEAKFRGAVNAHLTRLKRFCGRHRGIASGSLDQLLLCGDGDRLERAVEAFGETDNIHPIPLQVPQIDHLYEIDESDRNAGSVTAVAAVLPLLIGESESDVPDLLLTVRRAPDLSWASTLVRYGWPAIAALVALCISFSLVSRQRRIANMHLGDRVNVEASVIAGKSRLSQLARQRQQIEYLELFDDRTVEADWAVLFDRITKSLPDRTRLNEFHVDPNGQIRLVGTILDESLVYDLIGDLRRIPEVAQVALKGTSPGRETHGSNFVIHLVTLQAVEQAERASSSE